MCLCGDGCVGVCTVCNNTVHMEGVVVCGGGVSGVGWGEWHIVGLGL